jgi:hypothetical protein
VDFSITGGGHPGTNLPMETDKHLISKYMKELLRLNNKKDNSNLKVRKRIE